MNEKNFKNEINKRNYKKGNIFALVILMAIFLPLVSLVTVFQMEYEDLSIGTLRASESASWAINGIGISSGSGQQLYPEIISDGTGGHIITWQDERAGTSEDDIYAQKINSLGVVEWGENGTLICNAVGAQETPQIVSDGAGGAIITWHDERVASNQVDIYAQKINSAGLTQWDDNGTVICNYIFNQHAPEIISDNAGGAIITWYDWRSFAISYSDIYAQKINSAGITQWNDNGIIICNATDYQYVPKITSDGTGGAIMTWEDNRNSGTTGYDIYAQKITSAGISQWDDNGTVICNAVGAQKTPQIVSDGAGGAIITWEDERVAFNQDDIYAQKINSAGLIQWDDYWTLICNATGEQSNPELISDGTGGAIITWQDERAGTSEDDIYAQKKNTAGISQWDDNGTVICNAIDFQKLPKIVSDGAGGAIITWQDLRIDANDIYAQKIDSTGLAKWDDNGSLICNTIGNQEYPSIVSDGAEGAIITWQDERAGASEDDIYAQKIVDPPPSDPPIAIPSIAINSPINSTVFNSTAGLFNITVDGTSLHTVWYTMNGGPIHIIWYTMNGGSTQIFTIITTVDGTEWAAFANNTLVNVTFYANDTYGNQGSNSVQVYIVKTTPEVDNSNDDDGGIIPGFDLAIIGVLSVITVIVVAKMHDRKKKLMQK